MANNLLQYRISTPLVKTESFVENNNNKKSLAIDPKRQNVIKG